VVHTFPIGISHPTQRHKGTKNKGTHPDTRKCKPTNEGCLKFKGIKLDKFPLNLNFVIDLIYFEGPLLSLFKNESGDSYLYYWCDVDENYNRWMIIRLSKTNQESYILKKLSLNHLILSPVDGFVYILDIGDDLQYDNIYLVLPENLPERYIPETESFYDFESELDHEDRLSLLNYLNYTFDGEFYHVPERAVG